MNLALSLKDNLGKAVMIEIPKLTDRLWFCYQLLVYGCVQWEPMLIEVDTQPTQESEDE